MTYYYYNSTASAAWNSQYSNIASVNAGTVTGVSGGTSLVTAQFSDYGNWTDYPILGCQGTLLNGNPGSTANVAQLSISSPTSGAIYNLGGSNYNQATVPLQANSACSGTANWTLNYTYTDLQPATYTGTSSTSGTIGQTNNYTTPVGLGGKVVAQAQATLGGQQYNSSVTFWVLGTPIPNNTITTRLCGLYSGATSGLLTGIAMQETGYVQFYTYTEMGVQGKWPYGNQIAGQGTPLDSQVGLMQVPNGMTSSGGPAFDWYTNTSNGLSTFQGKLSAVQTYVSGLRSQHSGLPDLSGSQYEDNQLILYGGWLLGSNGNYFWVPNSTFTGWVKNTSAPGYSYVNTVRNDVQTCS